MFAITPELGEQNTNGKGFQITFANGWTVSVQWGTMNHCENRQHFAKGKDFGKPSVDAECAAFKGKEWLRLSEHDDVRGHMSPEEVVELLDRVSKM